MRISFALLLVPLSAAAASAQTPVSYRNEIVSVLARAGCNQCVCHGNLHGKGGFKLSLRGQDPSADFAALTRDQYGRRTNRQHPDLQLHEALNLTVLEKGQAESMRLTDGRIFVLTAGMMSEHTAAHDLALRMLADERMAIFFVGYADPDTPAGRLRAAKQGSTFLFSASGGEVTRKCEVEEFDLTAHANRDELVNFVGQVNPRTVLLGHGDTDSREWFETELRARYPKLRIIQPGPGKVADV